jgi:hypothetical protein
MHADLVAEDVVILEIKDEITRIANGLKNDLSQRRQGRKERSGPAGNESPSDSPKFPLSGSTIDHGNLMSALCGLCVLARDDSGAQ